MKPKRMQYNDGAIETGLRFRMPIHWYSTVRGIERYDVVRRGGRDEW